MATLYRMRPPTRHLTRNMAYIDAAWLDAHGADIPITVSFDHTSTVRETARLLSCPTRQVYRLMACVRPAESREAHLQGVRDGRRPRHRMEPRRGDPG